MSVTPYLTLADANAAIENAQAVDSTAKRVAAAGATINLGPQDMFWGDRFAELTDPFGHRWLLSAPKA